MVNEMRIEELQTSINDCMVEISEHESMIVGLKKDIEGMEQEIKRLHVQPIVIGS
jgi:hypothetical protein